MVRLEDVHRPCQRVWSTLVELYCGSRVGQRASNIPEKMRLIVMRGVLLATRRLLRVTIRSDAFRQPDPGPPKYLNRVRAP
jgi:hypothetical protein